MARTRGIEGLLTAPDTASAAFNSVDQTGFDIHKMLLDVVAPYSATLTSSAPSLDKTAWASTAPVSLGKTTDLINNTISFEARYPAAAANGGCGLVTFTNGYNVHTDALTVNMSCASYPADEFAATCPTSRAFTPGEISVSGTYSGVVSSSAALSGAGTTGAATLRLDDASTDATVAGNINITNWDAAIATGSPNRVTHAFEFDGDATMAGIASGVGSANAVFPAGVIGIPDVTEVILRAAGSRVYTVPAFWTSISMSLAFGSLVGFSCTMQCTGDLVIA